MKKVNSGEQYKSKSLGIEVSVNNVTKKGRGYQVTYISNSGKAYGLITSQTESLKSFELLPQK